jgi:hypothetical protein
MAELAAGQAPYAERARPNLSAYPSPTTARYLIFAVALLSSGLFVGNWIHTEVKGDDWRQTVEACNAAAPADTVGIDQALANQPTFVDCTADVERVRSAFIFGGAASAAATAFGLLVLTPRIIERRRRLKPLGPGLAGAAERFSLLAAHAGVLRRVRPVIGTAAQRDAFSYGAPGRYRVALPPAVAIRWRNTDTFDPLVAHELSHVARRDVALVWVVRSIWYVLIPILALPLVVGLLVGDPGRVLDYSWRVLVLAAAVLLLSNSLLRSREYDADLGACRLIGSPDQMSRLLGRTRAAPRTPLWFVRAKHPLPEQRQAAVSAPGVVARMTFLDGLVSGFLTSIAVPLLVSAFTTLLTTFYRTNWTYTVSALIVGPVLGATVGLGLARSALVDRVTGVRSSALPVAAGVGLGFVVGEAVSLAQSSTGRVTGLEHPIWLVVTALVGAGATLLSASMGQLWADVAPSLRQRRVAWGLGFIVNALIFSSVLWAITQFQFIVDSLGWTIARESLLTALATWPMFVVVVALAVAAAIPLLTTARPVPPPSWLIESGERRPWIRGGFPQFLATVLVAAITGLVGAACIVAYRAMHGPASELPDQILRFFSYVWVAGLSGAAAAMAISVIANRRGPGAALLATPIAALVTTAGYLVMNETTGGSTTWNFVGLFARPAVVAGFYLTLVVVPAAAIVRLALSRVVGAAGTATTARAVLVASSVVLASVLAVVFGTLALAGREDLVSVDPLAGVDVTPVGPSAHDVVKADFVTYEQTIVPDVMSRYQPIASNLGAIANGGAPGQEVTALDSVVISPLQGLIDDVSAYQPTTREVSDVHAHIIESLNLTMQSAQQWRTAFQTSDPVEAQNADASAGEAKAAFEAWEQARETLAGELDD